jgi:L-threonylcarbamoyladenylate synthase
LIINEVTIVIGKDIARAATWLRRDELVAIPTETVYGLAGNAFSEVAVARIFAVKNRPSFDPLIVHTSHYRRLEELVTEVPEAARRLAEIFLPGPLTLLLPRRPLIPDMVTSGSPLVAVRIPNHPLTLELLAALDFPVAAPSANPFGYISPTTAEHVAQQLGDKIPYILDGGPCHIGLESTIVGFPEGRATVYRQGGIAVEALEAAIGPVAVQPHSSSNPQAPGMLKSHYAPGVPLLLGDIATLLKEHGHRRVGLLSFRRAYATVPPERQVVLSETGDLTEAARHLFSGLRHLDQLDIELILAEPVPEEGLGRAINDRLRRAAAERE